MIVSLGSHKDLNYDLDMLQIHYESLGAIVVRRLPSDTTDSVFHRDIFAPTPIGLIKCNMGKTTRRWEPNWWFENMVIGPPVLELYGRDWFEGADLHWIRDGDLAVVAFGNRTSFSGARRVREFLTQNGWPSVLVGLPFWHDQHLLGVFNTIDDQVFYVPGFDWPGVGGIELPASEYQLKCSNWVVVGEYLLINEECRETIKIVEKYKRIIPVSIPSLIAHGGGVACATGIIQL